MTLVQIVLFVSNNDTTGIVLMCLVGVLTSFFSKNMIVILCVVLTITHLLKRGLKKEGFEDTKDAKETKEKVESPKEESGSKKEETDPKKDETQQKKAEAGSKKDESPMDEYDIPNSNERSEKTKDEMKRQIEDLKKDYPAFKELQDDLLEGLKKMDPLLDKAEAFMNKYSQYKVDKK
jgi:FtsZ-interacting cell division protein ZipA